MRIYSLCRGRVSVPCKYRDEQQLLSRKLQVSSGDDVLAARADLRWAATEATSGSQLVVSQHQWYSFPSHEVATQIYSTVIPH